MEQNLYDLMDWAGIEELVYSEASNPHAMLGPHLTESGLLIQALIPTAAQIVVKIASTGRKYAMELAMKPDSLLCLFQGRAWRHIRCL